MSKDKMMKAVVQVCGSVDPSLAKMVSGTNKSLGSINLKATAVGAAVVASVGAVTKELFEFGKASVKNAAVFQKEMQNVATLLDGTESQVADRILSMNNEILSVSNATGVATSDLSDGMYQVVSAFGDSADAIGILETAAKAGKAGVATTTDAVNLLSAVTKAYGDTSTDANNKVSDLAFNTVKLGQTTFPELASSMGKVTSVSSTLGVSQEELFGVFATATGVVGGAAEVSTQLKAVYTKLQKPTDSMAKAMSSMGYESGQAMIQNLGLQGTLEAITNYADNAGTNLSKLYGSSEAANLATALTGNLQDSLTEKTQAMYDSAGMTEQAFARQENSLEAMQEKITNLGENFKTEIGLSMLPMIFEVAQEALPAITDAIEDIKPVAEDIFTSILNEGIPWLIEEIPKISDFISNTAENVGELFTFFNDNKDVIGAVAAGVGTLVGALGLFNAIQSVHATVTGIATAAETAFGIATGTALAPILLITAGIAGAVAIGVLLYKNWDKIKEKAGELKLKLQEFAYGVKDTFSNAFQNLVGFISTPINAIIGVVNKAISSINALHISIPDWVPVLGGKEYSLNIPQMNYLATGGFTNGPSIAGEVPGQTEAVISFLPSVREENIAIWQKAGEMLGAFNATQQKTPLQLAGQLITFDDFSLADFGATTIIYYDFSGFEYHPEINQYGNTDSNDSNIIEQLEDNKYEFADWFMEFMSVYQEG